MEIHHFEHGWLTPTASYLLSVLGALLGLSCARRLRAATTTGGRAWWLSLSAFALGATGIWTMHFVALLGFTVPGTPIRYDLSLTVASAAVAVVAVGAGILVVFRGERARSSRILLGGVLAGLGAVGMHYLSMAGVNLNGEINYATLPVIASIAIAVLAATAALWLAATVRASAAVFGAALIMGLAVNGMHYTGMAAMSVRAGAPDGSPPGTTGTALLIPVGLTALIGVLGVFAALMSPQREEGPEAAALLDAPRRTAAAPLPAPHPVFGGGPAPVSPNAGPGQPGSADSGSHAGPTNTGPVPRQQRRSALGDASWTYRDRTPRQ
ncbi:MHYT domain-containing protein [Actinoplanes sp. NPDC051859]|uniref:MHYT domain-containing protein n=1 Tax=Actinoplanes sp. NPDC051859 TaxID=3363909 RepID=UPI0037BA18DF